MDSSLFQWVNDLARRTPWAHGAARLYAGPGIALFAVLLVVGYLVARHHDRPAELAAVCWAGVAPLVALGAAQVVGALVSRARPYDSLTGIQVLVDRTTDVSFPSDHATVAGAVAVGLLLANRRLGIVAGVAAVLMAATRVYVGAHYPGDVAAGLLLGGTVAAAGHVLVVPVLARLVARLEASPLRRLVTASPQPA